MPSFLINASAPRSTETSARLSTPQRGQTTGNLTMGFLMAMPRKLLPFVQRERNPYVQLGRVLVNECHLFGADIPYSVIPLSGRRQRRRCNKLTKVLNYSLFRSLAVSRNSLPILPCASLRHARTGRSKKTGLRSRERLRTMRTESGSSIPMDWAPEKWNRTTCRTKCFIRLGSPAEIKSLRWMLKTW
jgi:hypothetical protein